MLGFRGIFQILLGARDSCLTKPKLASPLNLTLYLNYNLNEITDILPSSLSSSILRNSIVAIDPDELGFFTLGSELQSNTHTKNLFQMISNGVLLVILITVLIFMMFVACFLFLTFYRKKIRKEEINSKLENNTHEKPKIKELDTIEDSLISRVRSILKMKCTLRNLSSLNASSIISKKKDEILTVSC